MLVTVFMRACALGTKAEVQFRICDLGTTADITLMSCGIPAGHIPARSFKNIRVSIARSACIVRIRTMAKSSEGTAKATLASLLGASIISPSEIGLALHLPRIDPSIVPCPKEEDDEVQE